MFSHYCVAQFSAAGCAESIKVLDEVPWKPNLCVSVKYACPEYRQNGGFWYIS